MKKESSKSKKEITIDQLAVMVQNGFSHIEKKMDERFEMVDEGFNKVDERFEGVDKRFDKMDDRLDRIEFSHVRRIEVLEDKVIFLERKYA
ncbi:MAG: hypothetical protein WCV55_03480 [Candidatus Paceibacterota bacterium]